MQLNLLQKLRTMLEESKIQELEEFLEFNIESFITSGEIANRLNIDYDISKKVTKELYRYDYVDLFYKQYCENEIDNCNLEVYESLESIPDDICEKCEKRCQIFKNIIIVYKVLRSNVCE